MEKKLDKIEEKLDKVLEDVSEIRVVQAEQAKDLKYHIKRSDLNEHRIEMVEEKLLPLIAIKNRFDGAFKVVGILSTIVGFAIGIAKIIFG